MHGQIKVWAHRGARSVAPENTLGAAQAALAQGADGWELDVHLTKDGQVIVIHDHGLRRTTNIAQIPGMPPRRQQVVNQVTLAQVKSLDAGTWFARRDPFGTVAAGQSFIPQTELAQEKVPTLREALLWSRDKGLLVNIELKDMLGGDDQGLVQAVVQCLQETKMMDQVLVSSFRLLSLIYFYELCPSVPRALLLDKNSLHSSNNQILALLHQAQAQAVHPALGGLKSGQIAFFRSAGFEVNVYTVNQEKDILWLANQGATGIITDFPGRAKRVLNTRVLQKNL